MEGGSKRDVAIIGAALDLGQERRGVDMGPSAIRYAGLAERLEPRAHGPRPRERRGGGPGGDRAPGRARAPAGDQGDLRADRRRRGRGGASRGDPLVLGGDHSVALGTLGGLASVHGKGGVLWIDAHSDINTPETSPSGNVHGMPWQPRSVAGEMFESDAWPLPRSTRLVALLGVRELDEGERGLLREAGVRVVTMSEIDRIGAERAVREAIDRIAGPGFVHVSLDMDALDPRSPRSRDSGEGLTYREAHLALELVAESGLAGSLEVVEVNPILDRENQTARRRRARRAPWVRRSTDARRSERRESQRPGREAPGSGCSRNRIRCYRILAAENAGMTSFRKRRGPLPGPRS